MKELNTFRKYLTEGVTADEIASRVRKLGKEKGIEDEYIEDYIDELDGNFEPDAYENSTDKDLLDDLKSYIDLSEGKINEDANPTNPEIEKAYQEAYEYETGNPLFISDFEYDSVEPRQTIKIFNLVSNDEELGDVTLIKTPEGWRLGA